MAEPAESTLKAALASCEAQIAALMASYQPDYSLDGQSESYSKSLTDLIKMRSDLRAQLIDEEGPAETHVQGYAG